MDSGGSANLIERRHVGKNFEIKNSKRPVTWTTANGKFVTNKLVVPEFHLPEFDERVTIKQPFHVCEHRLGYDMIIGRETLAELGFIIDFEKNQISWNDMNVGMKDPAFFDNKETFMMATQSEPETYQRALKRALNIIEEGRQTPITIDDKVNSNDHLTNDQKLKLKQLLNKYEELFDGSLGDWKTTPVSIDLKEDAKPYHSRPYPVPHIHKEQFKKELDSLEKMGVLKKDSSSQWAAPCLYHSKKGWKKSKIPD